MEVKKIMPDKLLELKNDLVFQKIFGTQKNKLITSHFLSLILEKEIFNLDLDANKRLLKNRKDSKTCRLDIRAKFNNGEDCNIELQVALYPYMAERMLEYWAGMYDQKISSGQGYEVLKPSFSILITNFELKRLKNIPDYHTIWNLREKKYCNEIISDNIELHILEIPKIKDNEILKDELAQWLKFIENPENKEVEKFMQENKFWKQAKEELAHLSGDPHFHRIVEARAGMLKDIHSFEYIGETKGLQRGMEKGVEKAKIEIAKKMKAKNMPIEEIVELTGLTKEEVEKL